MEHNVFSELSLVIVVTVLVSIVMKMIKQPLILGLHSGWPTSWAFWAYTSSTQLKLFEAFSEIGIALLLFIIGLGMHVGEFKKLGKVVFVGALSTLDLHHDDRLRDCHGPRFWSCRSVHHWSGVVFQQHHYYRQAPL
jgi:Kef-type K+ transport system membrane component KefB